MIVMKMSDVKGDCKIEGFKDYITLESFSFGVERELADSAKSGTADVNIGVGELQECSCSKSMDRSSYMLARKSINGSAIKQVEIKFVEATTLQGENHNVCYLHFILDTVFVKSWSMSGDADDRPSEDVALWYNKIAFCYYMTEDGKTFQRAGEVTWDHTQSKSWSGIQFKPQPEMVKAG